MQITISLQQLINSLRSQNYTAYRLEEKSTGHSVILFNANLQTIFELDEPLDVKGRTRLKSFLDDFRRNPGLSL